MEKSTSDILLKTKKSFEYIKDFSSLTLEEKSLKLKRYTLFAELGRRFFEIHLERGIDIPELSDLINKINGINKTIDALHEKIEILKSD